LKKLIFFVNLLLNLAAFVAAVLWIRQQSGYEPWIAAAAIVASSLNLFVSREHWLTPAGGVVQKNNTVGGDLAGRDINKAR
jgi:hypothetical protein